MWRQSPARRLCKYPNPPTVHPLPGHHHGNPSAPATPRRVLTQITFSRSKIRVTARRRTHFNNLEMLCTGRQGGETDGGQDKAHKYVSMEQANPGYSAPTRWHFPSVSFWEGEATLGFGGGDICFPGIFYLSAVSLSHPWCSR